MFSQRGTIRDEHYRSEGGRDDMLQGNWDTS